MNTETAFIFPLCFTIKCSMEVVGDCQAVIKFRKIITHEEVSGSWWPVAMKENM